MLENIYETKLLQATVQCSQSQRWATAAAANQSNWRRLKDFHNFFILHVTARSRNVLQEMQNYFKIISHYYYF